MQNKRIRASDSRDGADRALLEAAKNSISVNYGLTAAHFLTAYFPEDHTQFSHELFAKHVVIRSFDKIVAN